MALARLHNWIAGDVLTALDLNAEFNNIVNNSVQQVPLTSLTAKSFTYLDASQLLATTAAPTNGQLLIGSTGAIPVAAALTGTANQVVVTNGAGTITLSTPQSIAAASSPTFAALTLSGLGLGVVHSSSGGVQSSSAVVLTSEVSGILPLANGGTANIVGPKSIVTTHVGYTATIAQNTTVYINAFGHEVTETPAEQVMPAACTVSKMYVRCSTVGGAAQTITFTLRKNGADTAVATGVGSGATTSQDLTNTETFAAGDRYCVKCVLSATTGTLTGLTASFVLQVTG